MNLPSKNIIFNILFLMFITFKIGLFADEYFNIFDSDITSELLESDEDLKDSEEKLELSEKTEMVLPSNFCFNFQYQFKNNSILYFLKEKKYQDQYLEFKTPPPQILA